MMVSSSSPVGVRDAARSVWVKSSTRWNSRGKGPSYPTREPWPWDAAPKHGVARTHMVSWEIMRSIRARTSYHGWAEWVEVVAAHGERMRDARDADVAARKHSRNAQRIFILILLVHMFATILIISALLS